MSSITAIEITRHRLPLDPPFPAAWDPEPRRQFEVTIVRVHDDMGRHGVGSGDVPAGFEHYADLFVGRDPRDLDRHGTVLASVDFHSGRPWAVEAALWDLAGQIDGVPVFEMLGGVADRAKPYLSTGVLRSPAATADLADQAVAAGFEAIKIRFGRAELDEDFAVLAAVRDRVGNTVELMVDCNQGWRMPRDTRPAWNVDHAIEVAHRLATYDVYWMEEPLHRGDYLGLARLRNEADVPIAGGEMTRAAHEFENLLERECLAVYQPDAVLTMGVGAVAKLAKRVIDQGASFTPHTWGNGLGLLVNLHLTAGVGGGPYLELPLDPPEWTADRRDFMFLEALRPDADGWLVCSPQPGFGSELDEARLAATQVERVVLK